MGDRDYSKELGKMVKESGEIPETPLIYEMSLSNDGKHLLCRFPKVLLNGFNLIKEETDENKKEKAEKLILDKKWKIVFSEIDFENKSGVFKIKEK